MDILKLNSIDRKLDSSLGWIKNRQYTNPRDTLPSNSIASSLISQADDLISEKRTIEGEEVDPHNIMYTINLKEVLYYMVRDYLKEINGLTSQLSISEPEYYLKVLFRFLDTGESWNGNEAKFDNEELKSKWVSQIKELVNKASIEYQKEIKESNKI